MEKLLLFIGCFIVIYLLYLFTVVLQSKKRNKFKNSNQIQFFVTKYNLQFKNISLNNFIHLLAILNSLIMSLTVLIMSFIPNFILKFIVAFFVLIILILLCYSLLGIYVKKKEGK